MLFTPTVIKNLLKKPATRQYPFTVRDPFPNYRGELYIDIDACIFCGTCARKCPSQCIEVDKEQGLWTCNPHACVYCGICRDSCPTKCLHMKDVHRKPMTERIMMVEKGEPPKKKKAAPKAEPETAKAEAPAAKEEATKADAKKADTQKADAKKADAKKK
jgi:formate hydrogenlyase subunit 6/NADH:ubiquinone oxidoreductase subunit I